MAMTTNQFSVSDRIIMIENCDNSEKGWEGTIVCIRDSDYKKYGVRFDNNFPGGHNLDGNCESGHGHWVYENRMKLTSKKSIMKTLNNYIKKLVDGDTQALLKAGFINGDLVPTVEGNNALNSILFFEKKTELVKLANEKIAEVEAEEAKRG